MKDHIPLPILPHEFHSQSKSLRVNPNYSKNINKYILKKNNGHPITAHTSSNGSNGSVSNNQR